MQRQRIEALVFGSLGRQRLKQGIRHIIGKRPSEQKFHREVIDPLGIFLSIRLFCQEPALRNNVTDGMSRRFELLPHSRLLDINDVIEGQMPLIQRIVGAGKLDRSNSILLKQVFGAFGCHMSLSPTEEKIGLDVVAFR